MMALMRLLPSSVFPALVALNAATASVNANLEVHEYYTRTTYTEEYYLCVTIGFKLILP